MVSFKTVVSIVLLVLTFGIFFQTSNHEFLYFDDPQYVTDNPHVREGLTTQNILWAFSTTYFSNWHPLTWLSHMLDVELFGMSPGAHHLTNALLHAINAIILFLVLERMTGAPGRSAFVAALFAIHPLHVESVAWVSERKDVLSTLFGLLMLWAYSRYAAKPRAKWYLLVGTFFILSLLSKPMWVTAPFLFLLLDFWPLQRIKDPLLGVDSGFPPLPQLPLGRIVIEKVPLLLMSVASSVITLVAQSQGGALYSFERLSLVDRIENATASYVRYLGKTFWPTGLAAYYPQTDVASPAWQVIGAALLLLAITVFALRQVRAMPWLAVGWFWFLGTLVPVIGLVQVGSQAIADRYTYIPVIGIFMAFAWSAERVGRRASWMGVTLRVAAVLIVVLLSVITFRQIDYWRNHESLFRHTLGVTENNGRAHHILSQGLAVEGNLEEALFHAREAVRLDPNNARTHKNLGYILYQVGRVDEAIAEFQRAIALQPDYAEAHGNLAIAYGKKGWPDLARQEMLLERKLRAAQPAP